MSADWCRLWRAGRGRRLWLVACQRCRDVQAARSTSPDTACLRSQSAAFSTCLPQRCCRMSITFAAAGDQQVYGSMKVSADAHCAPGTCPGRV